MVDKELAISLREAGLTYNQIAESLGCSEIWCKTNLKGAKKPPNINDIKKKCNVLMVDGVVKECDVVRVFAREVGVTSVNEIKASLPLKIAYVRLVYSMQYSGSVFITENLYTKIRQDLSIEFMETIHELQMSALRKQIAVSKAFMGIAPTVDLLGGAELMRAQREGDPEENKYDN